MKRRQACPQRRRQETVSAGAAAMDGALCERLHQLLGKGELDTVDDDLDELSSEELETLEDDVVDAATQLGGSQSWTPRSRYSPTWWSSPAVCATPPPTGIGPSCVPCCSTTRPGTSVRSLFSPSTGHAELPGRPGPRAARPR